MTGARAVTGGPTVRTGPDTGERLYSRTDGGVGESAPRPDGTLKVSGEFAYGSDLWMDDMLWGTTLRSPLPSARIRSIDISAALAVPGVHAVLTHADVPGPGLFGLEVADQPVLARERVRYQGEPIVLVAADHPETARRAAKRVRVDYEELPPVTDAREALADDSPLVHDRGNLVRHVRIRTGGGGSQRDSRGDTGGWRPPAAEVVVRGEFEVGMQDQAFLGPESGLAVPDDEGGIDLHVATQWLHVDQQQICAALGLSPDQVRLTLAGVGGAFGGREDLSMHIHGCLLALHTGRPVKMAYSREESFFGHVHRHPARLHYEFGADRSGRLVHARVQTWLDGGAYASSTAAVVMNAATLGLGPYDVPAVHVDCWGVYTNNPPCGAMRGFGAVQAAFAYEAMMDRLAAAVGLEPVEVRLRNAMAEGSRVPTGQLVDSAAPVAELLERVRDLPLPPPVQGDPDAPDSPAGVDSPGGVDLLALPGGVSNTTHGEGVRRGVGYAVGLKNVGFSGGFDDYSTARVRLEAAGDVPVVTVHTAAAEVGQGLVAVVQQVCRTELGVESVVVAPSDTTIGSAGSTSASRQTYVTGGAVQAACVAVRSRVLERAARTLGASADVLSLRDGFLVGPGDEEVVALAELLGSDVVEETVEWRHRPTQPIDPETGQGDAHVQYAFAAHRAVVDVDVELGLVRVVELACAQDVGLAVNPQAVVGQIHGGSLQGLGLAVMEEVQVRDGRILNPSFTDYLVPTILDAPSMPVTVLEQPDPYAPYGLRGVGEPPTISSGPAVAAAIRAATGLELTRVPIRPEHLTGT